MRPRLCRTLLTRKRGSPSSDIQRGLPSPRHPRFESRPGVQRRRALDNARNNIIGDRCENIQVHLNNNPALKTDSQILYVLDSSTPAPGSLGIIPVSTARSTLKFVLTPDACVSDYRTRSNTFGEIQVNVPRPSHGLFYLYMIHINLKTPQKPKTYTHTVR